MNEFSEKYFVYVIKSKEGYHYTGLASDLDKRLAEHNTKSLSFWTKRGIDWKIIYKEVFSNYTQAIKREKWLKSGAGRDFLKENVNNY
ncbi:GIY-YIG nuclease family protein [Bacteroidota bacterium]